MLLRFEVGNHRSVLEPVELSMIAVDEDRPAARAFDGLSERVLTVCGIYGANASGKSNVLDALGWFSMAVSGSMRVWDEAIPREPFKFGLGPATPSTFEVDMIVTGVRYTYRLVVDDMVVQSETLYGYPERRPRMLFRREGQDLEFRRGLRGVAGTRELLTPTTLALSAAMRFPESEIRGVGRALADIAVLGIPRSTQRSRAFFPGRVTTWFTTRLFRDAEPPGLRAAAMDLLQFADLGIDDVDFVDASPEAIGAEPAASRMTACRQLRLLHRVGDERVPFVMEDESAGTQMWFNLIGPMLGALQKGQILLFDEIDASLHPRLSARIVELFQDPETNPHGAQLIFSSHATSLLNHLNRDEVWLAEKGDDGATTLTALAEYGGDKVRRSLNLEKAYLQGRFGAVPELDQVRLRHALGWSAGER